VVVAGGYSPKRCKSDSQSSESAYPIQIGGACLLFWCESCHDAHGMEAAVLQLGFRCESCGVYMAEGRVFWVGLSPYWMAKH
jgi:hypothetical protein